MQGKNWIKLLTLCTGGSLGALIAGRTVTIDHAILHRALGRLTGTFGVGSAADFN